VISRTALLRLRRIPTS